MVRDLVQKPRHINNIRSFDVTDKVKYGDVVIVYHPK